MKRLKKPFIYLLFIFLLHAGFASELLNYYQSGLTLNSFALFATASALMGIYLFPMIFILLYGQKRWQLPAFLLPVSLMSGLFFPSWLASLVNPVIENAWGTILPPKVFELWADALSAPYAEEILKLLAALFPLYFFRRWDEKAALIAGAGVGLGFQVSEDLGYILSTVNQPDTTIATAFYRLIGGFSTSHWMMTALCTLGFVLILSQKDYKKGGLLILLTMLAHFVWNSPLGSPSSPFYFHVILIVISSLYTGLALYCLTKVEQLPVEGGQLG